MTTLWQKLVKITSKAVSHGRRRALDGREKVDELLLPVALLAAAEYGNVEDASTGLSRT